MLLVSRRDRAVALELLGGDLKLLDGDLALIVFLAQRVVVKGVGVLPQVGVAILFFKSSRLCRSWCLHARARSGASDGHKCQACQSESIHPPRERVPYAWHARGALVTDQGRAERRRRASCRCRIYCEVSRPRPNNAVSYVREPIFSASYYAPHCAPAAARMHAGVPLASVKADPALGHGAPRLLAAPAFARAASSTFCGCPAGPITTREEQGQRGARA